MQIRAEEISAIIKEKIKGFDKQVDVKETGSVIQVGDGIAKVYGLDGAMAGEMLEFPGGLYGIALNLEEDNVGAVLMGDSVGVKEGDPVKRTGRIAEIPVGDALIGRVVNAIGQPIDGDHGTAWRDNARMQYRNCVFMELGERLVSFDDTDGDGGTDGEVQRAD